MNLGINSPITAYARSYKRSLLSIREHDKVKN